MRILTLNTWQERGDWQKRWEVTFEGIRHLQPDIIGFQELFNGSWAQEVQKRTGLTHLLFKDEKHGVVLYTRYLVREWGTETLSQSPLEEYRRYGLRAKLDVKGHPLLVLNTHLSWMLEDGGSRMKQTEELLQLLDEKAPNTETIMMGDLNAPRHSSEISRFIEKGNFRDLFFEKHPKERGYTWDNRNPYVAGAEHGLPDRRIDFILARNSDKLLKQLVSCEIVFTKPNPQGVWASDHYGVLAEFIN